MTERIHFAKEDNVEVRYINKICYECGERKVEVIQKGWWFWKEYLGEFCVNDRCRRGEKNQDIRKLVDDKDE